AANLAEQDAVRPVAERRFQEVADRHPGKALLRRTAFEPHEVRMRQVNLRGVLDQKNSLFFRYKLAEDIQSRCFPRAGAAADENVLPREDVVFEPVGELLIDGSRRDEILDSEVARVEFADR